jgi:phage gp36-like protein
MSWTTLSQEDVHAQLTSREIELLLGTGLAVGQASPLPDVLSRAVAEVRSYVPALRADSSLAAGLLPQSLHGAALDIIRYRLATRLASGRQASEWLLSEPRQKAYQDALAYLKDVARGLVAVDPLPAGGTPSLGATAGHFGSEEAFN